MIQEFDTEQLKKLYIPPFDSHKGQNGKLLLIGGSHLFHAASLWALTVASRIVDMVFYSSVPENNEIVKLAKVEFRNGIVIPRDRIEDYIEEADCVLMGPGMMRMGKVTSPKSQVLSSKQQNVINKMQKKSTYNSGLIIYNLEQINQIEDEGLQARLLTQYLLTKYPEKKWIIDAGALQVMEAGWLLPLKGNVVLTPHPKEFERLFVLPATDANVAIQAKENNCIILLKRQKDIVCSPSKCVSITGGNAGMTKGGTGDVLTGLVAALACKNNLFLSACFGSYINKKAGERLFERVGYYFNASDLANEIPAVMKDYI